MANYPEPHRPKVEYIVHNTREDLEEHDPQNGNVSRLLNQVENELSIMAEELGALAERLKAASISYPTEGDDLVEGDAKRPMMSPLAESVQLVLGKVRRANDRIREIKLGVDL